MSYASFYERRGAGRTKKVEQVNFRVIAYGPIFGKSAILGEIYGKRVGY